MVTNKYLKWLSETDGYWWTDSAVYSTMDEAIENGEIWEGDILGKVPADEAINYYHKLCKIDEELYFYQRDIFETGMEVYNYYYGVRYIDGEAEILRIGHDTSYTENKYAESIVEWMKEWEYE